MKGIITAFIGSLLSSRGSMGESIQKYNTHKHTNVYMHICRYTQPTYVHECIGLYVLFLMYIHPLKYIRNRNTHIDLHTYINR